MHVSFAKRARFARAHGAARPALAKIHIFPRAARAARRAEKKSPFGVPETSVSRMFPLINPNTNSDSFSNFKTTRSSFLFRADPCRAPDGTMGTLTSYMRWGIWGGGYVRLNSGTRRRSGDFFQNKKPRILRALIRTFF